MKSSIATVSLSGDLREKLDAIAGAGYDGVEIFENDFLASDASPQDLVAMLEDLGLTCTAFQPFRDFEGLPEPQRGRAFERAERKFDLMGQINAPLLLICSNVSPAALGGIDRAAEDLHALGERAARHGLRIGFEALAWGRHINDHRDAWEAVRRADHPNVGVILDTFHSLALGLPTSSISSIPKEKISLVQIADAPLLELDVLQWSRHFRCFPGQGDLPVEEMIADVLATGYDDVLSLEIFNDQFRGGSAQRTAIDGMRSLVDLQDRVSSTADGKRPTRAGSDSLPPHSRCLGVEFIEFAVDEGSAAAFGDLLNALGFRKRGRHKSKAVEQYAQGNINIVVNCEKEGFAHSYNIVHGDSVCALALRVDDAEQTKRRAQALRAQHFHQPVAPGELDLPAIRGVGGSLLYFTDQKSDLARLWEIDFEPVDTAASDATDAVLADIDHIAQTIPQSELLSWKLFYTAIFDLKWMPQVDVADPGGLIHSQVLQTPDSHVRLILNAPHYGESLAARFLSESSGASVQHIAFATDDVFAAMERLRANGVPLLDIPENYYDDLGARFDLEDSLLDRLRQSGLMYDRDEFGEYFQFYTAPIIEGLFFEIVQRTGYEGFGLANASVRLAAQQRAKLRALAL